MATDHLHHSSGQSGRPIEFVGGNNCRCSLVDGLSDQRVDEVSTGLVEAGMGFVEEPQSGAPTHHHGHRRSLSLASRQVADRHRAETTADTQPLERGVDAGRLTTIGGCPEADVLLDSEIVIERRAVAEQPDMAAHRTTPGPGRDVEPHHLCRATLYGGQAGTEPQQGALPGPVRALQEDDLAGVDPEVCAGQRRESPEQADGLAEQHDGVRHGWHDTALRPETEMWGSNGWAPTFDRGSALPSPGMSSRTALIVGGVGRAMIGLGVIVMSFAGFQLYGTNILEAQSQDQLEADFDQRIADLEAAGLVVTDTTPTDATSDEGTTDEGTTGDGSAALADEINAAIAYENRPKLGDPNGPQFEVSTIDPEALSDEQIAVLTPRRGDALGRIEIPRIKLDRNLVEGIGRSDLREGPGHYGDTPLPGQPGNSAIAGHRTTYGAPFGDLDKLQPGDLIKVTTVQGEHYYEVSPQIDENGEERGYFIVEPTATEVLDDFGDNRLTLTACHPKRSSRQRIIVTAQLVSAPQPVLPELSEEQLTEILGEPENQSPVEEFALEEDSAVGVDENSLEASLGWNLDERSPTLVWGLGAAAVALAAVVLAQFMKKWLAYLLAAPPFLYLLFFTFVHLDRLLPAL